MQVGDARPAWLAFCKAISGEPAVNGNAGDLQSLPYHERIPQLTSRMGSVLAPGIAALDASEGRPQCTHESTQVMKLPQLSYHNLAILRDATQEFNFQDASYGKHHAFVPSTGWMVVLGV